MTSFPVRLAISNFSAVRRRTMSFCDRSAKSLAVRFTSYQDWPRFVEDMTKTFWDVFSIHSIQPYTTCAECRCTGHTWSLSTWSCPSGTEGAPLAASHLPVALLMFMVYDNHCPSYLRESVASASSDPARQRLRSASNLDFIGPRTWTKFGDRAFLLSVRRSGRSTKILASFIKSNPQTHLFNTGFN